MAEAYLKKFGGRDYHTESAGLEPGTLNPLAIAVMKEEGMDISGNHTKSVFDFHHQRKIFHYVITVCDPSASEQCPIFPGMVEKINWGFADPSKFTGTPEEKLQQTRVVRDQIKAAVQRFVAEHNH